MIAIAMAGLMQLLDVSVVNIALPDIERDLGASFNELRWVIDANALTLAATVLIYGTLGDRLGRRRVFTAGMIAFSALSLACGLAWSPLSLDILRAFQGLAAAAMLATGLALIGATYSGRERNTALAVWGVGIGVALAIGPLLGGVLVETVGWRAVFCGSAGLGLLALAGRWAMPGPDRAPTAQVADAAGPRMHPRRRRHHDRRILRRCRGCHRHPASRDRRARRR